MKGENILESLINQELEEVRVQSFILNGDLVERISVTFLKFDEWIIIVSSDGITSVKKVDNSFDDIESHGEKEFFYPIEQAKIHFPQIENFIGKKIINWKELVSEKYRSQSFGINLYFENDLNLMIHNQDCPIDENEFIFNQLTPSGLIEK